MESTWKVISSSVLGTSHERLGEPCQDYAHGVVVAATSSPILVVVCSDGAGSASHAALGAKLACLDFVRLVSECLLDGLPLHKIDAQQELTWHDRVRSRLSLEASVRGLELRDLACTLLTAVVGEEIAVFSQIGDGAIVYPEGEGLTTAFWPQMGEYASTTNFLTGQDFGERLEVRSLSREVDDLALLTDGLQPLALHYASRSVHGPFFKPMFEALRQATDPDSLEGPLRDFLQSKPVTDRTDDDKTLILATRRPSRHASS